MGLIPGHGPLECLRRPLRWMFVFSMATNLLMLTVPLHMMQVYDRVLSSGSLATLIYITLITLLALAIYGVIDGYRGVLAQRMANRFMVETAERTFRHIVKKQSTLDERERNDSGRILRELETLRAFISGRAAISFFDLPFMPVFLLFLFLLHPTLGLLALIGMVVLAGLTVMNKLITEEGRSTSAQANSEAMGFSQTVLRRADDIQAMGVLPAIMERWGRMSVKRLNAGDGVARTSAMFFGAGKAVRQALQVTTLAWAGYLVLQGSLSGGVIFAASLIMSRALMPIEQLIGGWSTTMEAKAAYATLQSVLREADSERSRTRLPDPAGLLEAEALTFNPGEDRGARPILDGVSFSVRPGRIAAIVGPSGAGKSTLARLLVGAARPTSGTVRLDGFELDQWRDDQRAGAIGYVPQDIALFPGTIAENIARLEIDADDQEVVKAAGIAGIHDMIAGLPEGYATVIGPETFNLSGGQRQRVALARALYGSPKVLVLDEPNAHLDSAGEERLAKALQAAAAAGAAIVVVTQRRALLSVADDVLTLDAGKIVSRARGGDVDWSGVREKLGGAAEAGIEGNPGPPPIPVKAVFYGGSETSAANRQA